MQSYSAELLNTIPQGPAFMKAGFVDILKESGDEFHMLMKSQQLRRLAGAKRSAAA